SLQGAINRGALKGYPLARPIERPIQNGTSMGPEEGVEGECHAAAAVVGQDDVADIIWRSQPFEVDARRRALGWRRCRSHLGKARRVCDIGGEGRKLGVNGVSEQNEVDGVRERRGGDDGGKQGERQTCRSKPRGCGRGEREGERQGEDVRRRLT